MNIERGNLKVETEVESIKNAAIKYREMIFEGASHGHAVGSLLRYLKEHDKELYDRANGDEYDLIGILEDGDSGFEFEGFVTSQGRYVTREEAQKIAERSHQTGVKKSDSDDSLPKLFSENLKG